MDDIKINLDAGFTSAVGGGQNRFGIRVEDGTSHTLILTFDLDADQLMKALAGGSVRDVAATWWGGDRVGKVCEVEQAVIPGLDESLWHERERIIDATLTQLGRPREDGWSCDDVGHERFNRRRYSEDGYQVTIRRYVDPPVDDPA